MTLQKLLIREKASDSRGIYIISSNPANPEMYELKVQNPKDKNVWIQSIRSAVLDCPPDETGNEDTLTADQKQKHIDERQAYIRELICKSIIIFHYKLAEFVKIHLKKALAYMKINILL